MIFTPEIIESLVMQRQFFVGHEFVLTTPAIAVKYGVLSLKITLDFKAGYLIALNVSSTL